jgi:RNA polymerase sigma-70 factor (ECF subfamily)
MPSLEDQHAALGRFAYLVAGDLDLARDLTQEAFLQAAGRGLDLEAPASLPYLRAIVVNLWRRRFRRLAAEARALVRVGSVPPAAGEEAVDDRDLVWRALRRLPPRIRVCLVLRYYEDLPVADIARELGRPEGTVRSWLSRGLARLAQEVERDRD